MRPGTTTEPAKRTKQPGGGLVRKMLTGECQPITNPAGRATSAGISTEPDQPIGDIRSEPLRGVGKRANVAVRQRQITRILRTLL